MVYFILAFLIVLADQASKYIITLHFAAGGQLDLIPGILRITYITNSGGAFSMFSEHTLALAIVSAVVCVVIIILIITIKRSPLAKLAMGMILGGAIGNLIDRFVMGYVVDMFEPLFVNFAVFNVADIFITIGAILFVIAVIFFWPNKDKKEEIEDDGEYKGPAPVTYEKPKNLKDRRAQRHAKKYGPDIDETTIIIPVDEVKAAVAAAETKAESYDPELDLEVNLDDTIIVNKADLTAAEESAPEAEEAPSEETAVSFESEKLAFDLPDLSAASVSGDHEFTLEEIMKEYGHDF